MMIASDSFSSPPPRGENDQDDDVQPKKKLREKKRDITLKKLTLVLIKIKDPTRPARNQMDNLNLIIMGKLSLRQCLAPQQC